MRVPVSRLIALVVLIVGIACFNYLSRNDAYAAAQREQTNIVYLPIIPVRSSEKTGDFDVFHMGLYQSVQSHDNDVTLIAHKPALLRIYARMSQFNGVGPMTLVRVNAYRNGQFIGSVTSDLIYVSSEPSADDMNSTYNIDLPLEWLSGNLMLMASIDASDSISEINEGNNSFQASFQFQEVAPLNLTIVPINYIDTVTGMTYSEAGHDPLSSWLLSAFPLSDIIVDIHEPLTFTGNLRIGEEWGRLLGEVTTLWGNEVGAGSSHIYYGLIPNSSSGGAGWFQGGISGLGWIGQRVSVGLDVGEATGSSAAHEIGHNFGRRHAPCGNPNGVDPNFPYQNASIGVFGVDTLDERLLDPDLTHDVMSYCGPEWVSDYTYEGLFQDQSLRGGNSTPLGEGEFYGFIADSKQLNALRGIQSSSSLHDLASKDDYDIQLLDNEGRIIASYPGLIFFAEEEGVSVGMIGAIIPGTTDTGRIATVQVVSDGIVILGQNADTISGMK